MGFLVVFLIYFYLVLNLFMFLSILNIQLSLILRTERLKILIEIILLITEFIQIHHFDFLFSMDLKLRIAIFYIITLLIYKTIKTLRIIISISYSYNVVLLVILSLILFIFELICFIKTG
jgi:hypothetical protein